MLMSRRCAQSFVLAALIGFGSAHAKAESAASSYALQACALAYENSQEHRRGGAFSVARSELARCSQDDCPGFIRTDCVQWSKEAEAQQPSVLFAAQRGGRDLTEVRVSIGDRVLTEHLPSPAVELDPGTYDIEFEAAGSAAIVRHAVLRAGDKNLLIQVDLAVPPESPAQPHAAFAAPRAAGASSSDGQRAAPWVLLGVGAASLGAGVGFSAWGHSSENHLRAICAPNCTGAEVQPVRTKYLIGDLSLGVGLVSLSVAAYLFLSSPAPEERAESALPLTIVAGPSRVSAAYEARF